MTWRWIEDGGDWHLEVDDFPVAMLCCHHDDFFTTIVRGDRQDFAKLDDAIARIAIDLLIRDLKAPSGDIRVGELLIGNVAQLQARGVAPKVIREAVAQHRRSS